MGRFYEPLILAFHRFREWKNNIYMIVGSILFTLLCVIVGNKYLEYSANINMPVQLLEPLIATLTNHYSLVLITLIIMLMFNDLPSDSKTSPYYLIRTTRFRWMIAQFIYVIFSLIGLFIIAAIVSVLMSMKNGYIQNTWSDTAYFSAYDPNVTSNINILLIKNSSPLSSLFNVFSLLMLYSLFIACLFTIFNFLKQKFIGLIVVGTINLWGYIYSFQVLDFTKNIGNWLDFNYVSYCNSYNDRSVLGAYAFFTIMIIISIFISINLSRKYQFNFKLINKGAC